MGGKYPSGLQHGIGVQRGDSMFFPLTDSETQWTDLCLTDLFEKIIPLPLPLSKDQNQLFWVWMFFEIAWLCYNFSKRISHLLTTYWIISLGIQTAVQKVFGPPKYVKKTALQRVFGCPGYWTIPTRSFKVTFNPLAGGHLTIKKGGHALKRPKKVRKKLPGFDRFFMIGRFWLFKT